MMTAFMLMLGCTEDNNELAGTCVTCVFEATTTEPAVTIEACANGDGTITLTENGVETVTSDNDTSSFAIAQESTGANCN